MKNNYAYIYFLSRSLFLGLVFSKMFGYVGSDSVISCILGIILGIILITIINKIKINTIFHRIIYFVYLTLLIILGIVIGENFCSYFFLTKMPRILIVIPAMIICIYISLQSNKTLNIYANIQLLFSLFIVVITLLMLTPLFNYSNYLPLFNHSIKNISKASFIFGVYSSTPNILLNDKNIPLKKHIKYYVITSLINLIICIFIIGVLKPSLLTVYSFPEYMVLKNIKIFGFIENIENFISSVWLFDLFLMISLTNKKIIELFNDKIIGIFYIVSLSIFTTYIIIPNYNLILIIYYYASLILFIITILLSIKKKIISNGRYK